MNHFPLKSLIVGIILLAIAGASIGYYCLFAPNVETKEPQYLLIYPNDTYEDVLHKIENSGAVKNITSFKMASLVRKYPDNVKAGRYELSNGNNLQLIQRLLRSRQTPVRITFNNIRTQDVLAERITSKLMMSDSEFLSSLNNAETLKKYNTNKANIVSLFIPNTYEVYWNISPDDLIDRMKKEYDKFWNEERQQKLSRTRLSQAEVSILASIVEEETLKADEKPMVAGLYINRLRQGMLLQADPTIKFALQDFSLKRISGVLNVDSPYNTYKYVGLPPGPIRIPNMGSIDAVLNYVEHNYIFMCAKEDFSGYHNFTASYEEHMKNASRYHKELERRNIH